MKTKRTLLEEILLRVMDVKTELHQSINDRYNQFQNIKETLRSLTMKIDELLDKVDSTTNETAARVQALIDAIKAQNGTLTPEQEAEANTIVAHLQAIGADPSNPVPPLRPSNL